MKTGSGFCDIVQEVYKIALVVVWTWEPSLSVALVNLKSGFRLLALLDNTASQVSIGILL